MTPPSSQELTLHTVSAGGYSATADAFAISPDNNDLWFLSMVGSQVALKAIAASLIKLPPDKCHILQGVDGMEITGEYRTCQIPLLTIGTWTTRTTRLANRAFHTLVYTKKAHHNFNSADFIILPRTPMEAPSLHHMYLDARSSIPIHHTWHQWLWERGLRTGEVIPLDSSGILAYHCTPQFPDLKADITDAIVSGFLTVPR